jgi:hypothetical protein
VFTKYPFFGVRQHEALVEIFGEERGRKIVMKGAEDGSGSVIYLFSPQNLRSADLGRFMTSADMRGVELGQPSLLQLRLKGRRKG